MAATRQRQRKPDTAPASTSASTRPSLPTTADMANPTSFLRQQPLWIILAVASGACAALNGVFAKLTTTALTSTLAASISRLLNLAPDNTPIEFLTRAFFFALNLVFNALMWALFTAALTRGDSTTRVSVVNVSSNFMITAVLGWVVFGESLPGLWWVGAGLLAVGNVVIGRRDGGGVGKEGLERRGEGEEGAGLMAREGDLLELEEEDDDQGRDGGEARRLRKGEDADAPL